MWQPGAAVFPPAAAPLALLFPPGPPSRVIQECQGDTP